MIIPTSKRAASRNIDQTIFVACFAASLIGLTRVETCAIWDFERSVLVATEQGLLQQNKTTYSLNLVSVTHYRTYSGGYKFWLPNGQKYFGACRPTALAGFYHAERFQPDWKPRQRIWKCARITISQLRLWVNALLLIVSLASKSYKLKALQWINLQHGKIYF